MLLELKKVRVYYGAVEAIKGVSMEASEGSIVALLGANGAGKTTLLRAISGLKRSNSGEICFMSERIDNMPVEKITKRGVVHVPEGGRIFPDMTVLENLYMGAYLQKKGEISRLSLEVYSLFPVLEKRRDQIAGTLSGGERQMLAIGRSLMASPKLLLLDEPSMGLSPLVILEIYRTIEAIHRRGKTIILVEQNARQALKLAQSGYVLQLGEIILKGPAAELFESDYVRKAYLGG